MNEAQYADRNLRDALILEDQRRAYDEMRVALEELLARTKHVGSQMPRRNGLSQ